MVDAITHFLVLAIVTEAVVEWIKTFIPDRYKTANVVRLAAFCISLLLCFAANIDVLATIGIPLGVPYVGIIVTAIFGSRGSNYASDIIARLRGEEDGEPLDELSELKAEADSLGVRYGAAIGRETLKRRIEEFRLNNN